MRSPVDGGAALSRPLPTGLVYFAVAAGVIAAGEAALQLQNAVATGRWVLVVVPIGGCVYVAAGLLAWTRRPANRMGPLLCAGGLLWFASGAVGIDNPALFAVGLIAQTTPLAFLVHALLAFPSGRLRSPVARGLTCAAYAVAVLLQAPLYLFRPPGGGPDVLWVADRPDIVAVSELVQAAAGLVVLAATGVVLVRRVLAADREHRRVLLPVYGCGFIVLTVVTTVVNVLHLYGRDSPLVVTIFQAGLLVLVPVAFVAGVLRGGFARTGRLEELGQWLGAAGARPDLQSAVAQALGEPNLRLGYRFGEGWVDANGLAMELPAEGSGQSTAYVELDGRPVGAIVYNAGLVPDPETVRTAGRVVAIALDRERLTAQLLASQEDLLESRTRLVEAGDLERRRLAQDLHDRLQGRLTLLALRVGNARPGDDLAGIRDGLEESITELRWLVQGVMPALLLERGLAAAVEDLADRVPIRTVLDFGTDGERLDERRLPESVEGTAYAVIAEALTNAVKHSSASNLAVSVKRAGGQLRIEVADDGVGGAGPASGLGLRGMTDRVRALGGSLTIESPPAAGTRVLAELPCAS